MACNIPGLPDKNTRYFEEAQKRLESINPTKDGAPIYSIQELGDFLYGSSYSEQKNVKDLFFNDVLSYSSIMGDAFTTVVARLLRQGGLDNIVQAVKDKEETILLNGEQVPTKELSTKEILYWVGSKFQKRVSTDKGGGYFTTHIPKVDVLHDFLYSFYSDLEANRGAFTSAVTGSATIELGYKMTEEGGKFSVIGLSNRTKAYLNESMTGILFDLMTPNQLSDIFSRKEGAGAVLGEHYGNAGDKGGSVISILKDDLTNRYNTLVDAYNETKKGSPKRKALQRELLDLKSLKDPGGLIDSNWPLLIKGHLAHLAKNEFYPDYTESEIEAVDEADDTAEVNTRDALGITPAHEVNPASRLSRNVKTLISTLPVLDKNANGTIKTKKDGSYQFVLNKLGGPKLANPSDITGVLYKSLANISSPAMMVSEMNDLAKDNPVYNILLERMGLQYGDWSYVDELSKDQMKTLVSFLTAFSNAKPLYQVTQVTSSGQRSMNDANTENNERLVKSTWQDNFITVSQSSLGTISKGRQVLNLDHKFRDGYTLADKLKHGGNDIQQRLDLLSLLGIQFTNPTAVAKYLDNTNNLNKFMNDTMWIFTAVRDHEGDVNTIFNLNVGGNLKSLIKIQLETSDDIGSLSFRAMGGGKVYAVSLKGFIDVISDSLNYSEDLVNRLKESPTTFNSVWLTPEMRGTIKLSTLMGTVNTETQRNSPIGRQTPGDIAVQQVSSILNGFVPFIKEGNKTTKKAIQVGGSPDFNFSKAEMVVRLIGYLEDELITAHKIRNGAAKQIKGLSKKGKNLQFFAHKDFEKLNTDTLLRKPVLTRDDIKKWVQEDEVDVPAVMMTHLNNEIKKIEDGLVEYNVVKPTQLDAEGVPGAYMNIGIDNNHLDSLNKSLEVNGREGDNLYPTLFNKLAEQIAIIRLTSIHEQFKVFLGHPANFPDLFKRTSLFIGPKKYPLVDDAFMAWIEKHYPNQSVGNENRYEVHSPKEVRFVTRKEVTEISAYTYQYVETLKALGHDVDSQLMQVVKNTYGESKAGSTERGGVYSHSSEGMEIFDGGGVIHVDFYRRVRLLTDSWSKKEEQAYQNVINGTADKKDIGVLSPLKPQVVAQALEDGIDFRVGNKFALFPIHPNLMQVLDGVEGRTISDAAYEDMNKHKLDYMVSESSAKTGAKMNSKLEFDAYLTPEGGYSPLKDDSAVQTYGLEFFGIQMDPKNKRSTEVSQGTQSMAMMLTNIFDQTALNEKYQDMPFSKEESWEQAGDRFHKLQGNLIIKETQALAARLGFHYLPSQHRFDVLDSSISKKAMRDTILDEMSNRDISETLKDTILAVFDGDTNLLNQVGEKTRLETILTSIITKSIVRRKMPGDMVVLQSNFGFQVESEAVKFKNAPEIVTAGLRKLKSYRKDISDEALRAMSPEERANFLKTADTLAMEVYLPHYFKEFFGSDNLGELELTDEIREAIGFRIPTEGYNSIEYIKIVGFLPQSAGSTIIVPSEIVAKSGADFDIDKLTLYLPNVEVRDGKIQKVRSIDPANATLEDIQYLRTTDLNLYRTLMFQALPSDEAIGNLNEINGLIKNKKQLETFLKDYKDAPEVKAFNAKLKKLKEVAKNLTNKVAKEEAYSKIDKEREEFSEKLLSAPHTIFKTGEFKIDNAYAYRDLLNEELFKYDMQLYNNLYKFTFEDIQTKQYVQNQVMDIMRDILKHPLSFDQLITPVGAFELKDGAYEVGRKIDEGRKEEDREFDKDGNKIKKNLLDMLSFSELVELEYIMNQTLGGTGVVATSGTHQIKMQRTSTAFKSAVFNFKLKDPNHSISRVMTADAMATINSLMQQYISGYVDGEKDPFVMYVNAGKALAPIHMLLLRVGVPLKTTLAFMSQPIIFDYLKLKNRNQTLAAGASKGVKGAYLSDNQIKETLLKKYAKTGENLELDEEQLMAYVGADFSDGQFDMFDKKFQTQVLLDFLSYKDYANQLRELELIHSYDKLKLKNISEIIYLEALEKKVIEDDYFTDATSLTSSNTSMLTYGRDAIQATTNLVQNVDLKSYNPEIRKVFGTIALNLLRSNYRKDDVIYILNKFDNFVSASLIQNSTYAGETLSEMAPRLFQGANSLPRRIDAAQKLGDIQNLALDNLRVVLDPYVTGTELATVDGLKMARGKYDNDLTDVLVDEMRNLKNEAPDLYWDLHFFSLLQTGLDYNPNSFASILPPEDVKSITNKAFDIFMNKPDPEFELTDLYHRFIDNNWHNSVVTHQQYLSKHNPNAYLFFKDKIEADLNAFPHVQKNSLTLFMKVEGEYYYSHFTRNNKGSEWLRSAKMGVRNKLVEAGSKTSIISSNVQTSTIGQLSNNVDVSRKILSGKKILHYSTSRGTDGNYGLGNGALISVKRAVYGKLDKVLSLSKELGDNTSGNKKWSKYELAKAMGFRDIKEAMKVKDLTAFFNGTGTLHLHSLRVISPGSTEFLQESPDFLMEELARNSASTSSLEDLNQVKDESNKYC
jgi:hypothetical protein